MSIKAIFTDMDGTLLVDNFSTTQENIKKIEEATGKGIHIVLTTGRALGDIPKDIMNIKGLEYLILANGAIVYDIKKQEIIYDNYMDKETVLELLESEGAKDICYFVMINGKSHYQPDIFNNIKDTPLYDILVEFLDYDCVVDDNIIEAIKQDNANVEKLVVYFRDAEHRFKAVNLMPQLRNFDCANSFELNIEITKKGINKAIGIGFLCEKLGITADEIVTIGDSGNDEEMLKLTAHSYAVENAMQVAKNAAKFIAPKNTENAVAWVIDKYI